MNKKVVLGLAAILILALVGVGIYRQVNKKQEKEVIKVGAILPLTGTGSVPGGYIKNGMDLVFSNIDTNKIKINVFYDDSKSAANQGIAAYNKQLKINKVDVVITALSSVTMSIIPVMDTSIPVISTLTTYPDITRKNTSLFRVFINSTTESKTMANYIASDLNIKTIALAYNNDEGGIGSRDAFVEEYKKLFGKIINEEPYPANDINFRNIVAKIKNHKAIDGILVIGFGNSLGILIKQIREANIKVPIFTLSQFGSSDSRLAAGTAAKDVVYTSPAYNYSNSIEKKKFDSLYFSRYQQKPNFIAAFGYETALLVIKSIENLNRGKNVKNSLLNVKITGVSGDEIKFTPSREIQTKISIVKWDGSSEELIK